MFEVPWSRLRAGLDATRSFVRANDRIRAFTATVSATSEPSIVEHNLEELVAIMPAAAQWRILDHCAAISRIYAHYEQFVESTLSELVEFHYKDREFSEISEKVRKSYQHGFVHLVGKVGEGRYSHIAVESFVSEYNSALSGNKMYRLFPECLTFHQNNLRLSELKELFARFDLGEFDSWLNGSPSLADHFGTRQKLKELSESKLRKFVQYRNDASHGDVDPDNLLGLSDILEYIDFIEILSECIVSFVRFGLLTLLSGRGEAHQFGAVVESFSNNVVVANIEGITLKVGDQVTCSSERYCASVKIESIQLDGADVSDAVVAAPKEVGLKLSSKVPARARLYRVG